MHIKYITTGRPNFPPRPTRWWPLAARSVRMVARTHATHIHPLDCDRVGMSAGDRQGSTEAIAHAITEGQWGRHLEVGPLVVCVAGVRRQQPVLLEALVHGGLAPRQLILGQRVEIRVPVHLARNLAGAVRP